MIKRLDSMSDRPPKRQKVVEPEAAPVQLISSARQLQTLLIFQQDSAQDLRDGTEPPCALTAAIRSFKAFLETTLYSENKKEKERNVEILKSYLASQASDEESLPHLLQAWSFASQNNNDGLVSAVSSLLALLLRVVSTRIELRSVGFQLCTTLLAAPQLKLISRSLSQPKHKEYVISPSVRLMTELVSYDGGTMAKQVFASKTFTFDGKVIARNLGLWKDTIDEAKPAVRTHTVRYVLANMKYLAGPAKTDFLRYGNVIHNLFEHMAHDPHALIVDILDAIRKHVLNDESIPRKVKGYVLNDRNLANLGKLYSNDKSAKMVHLDVL